MADERFEEPEAVFTYNCQVPAAKTTESRLITVALVTLKVDDWISEQDDPSFSQKKTWVD